MEYFNCLQERFELGREFSGQLYAGASAVYFDWKGRCHAKFLAEKDFPQFPVKQDWPAFRVARLAREVLNLAVPIAKLKEYPEDMRIKWLAPESHWDGMFSRLHPKDIWVNPFFCVHPMDVVATVIHELTHKKMMERAHNCERAPEERHKRHDSHCSAWKACVRMITRGFQVIHFYIMIVFLYSGNIPNVKYACLICVILFNSCMIITLTLHCHSLCIITFGIDYICIICYRFSAHNILVVSNTSRWMQNLVTSGYIISCKMPAYARLAIMHRNRWIVWLSNDWQIQFMDLTTCSQMKWSRRLPRNTHPNLLSEYFSRLAQWNALYHIEYGNGCYWMTNTIKQWPGETKVPQQHRRGSVTS